MLFRFVRLFYGKINLLSFISLSVLWDFNRNYVLICGHLLNSIVHVEIWLFAGKYK